MFAMEKPLPLPNEDSVEYWEGCKRGELLVEKCGACGHLRFPPAIVCPRCLSTERRWERMSGRGKVYTFIVVHRPQHPAFYEDVPYNVAIIELDEGPRMHSRIVGCPNEEIRIGMPVEVAFEKKNDDVTMPYFRPRQE
ncbi:MAG: Zn-ribbon domain-containing OB-fold protein [Candidatus Binatia bacterium]